MPVGKRNSFKMHWCEKPISLLRLQLSLLLFFLVLASDVNSESFAGLLQTDRVIENFNIFVPKRLLANYRAINSIKDARVRDSCASALRTYTRAIDRQESWALKMLDASSTVPSGILEGNIVELGSYDECVQTTGQSAGVAINGQHCMYEIMEIREHSILPYNPTMSICLPRNCTVDDLAYLIKATANLTGKTNDLEKLPVSASCTNEDWKFWDMELVFLMFVVGVYISFLIVCTICDLMETWSIADRKPNKGIAILVRFSFMRNFKELLTLKPQPSNIPVINGIRFISSLSIILFHEYILFGLVINSNVFYIYEWLSSWKSVLPLMTTFSVDTFFTLSGFLMFCSFQKQVKKPSFSVISFYIHRFIRITAPIVPIILTSTIILPKLGSGPRWQWTKEVFLTSCRSKWWSLLLHIQNIVQIDNYCLLELWSCSADMQLYTISLLILYFFNNKPQIARKIFIFLIAASIIITGSIVGVNGYYTTYISRDANTKLVLEQVNNVYIMTYTRSSPFFIGILLGDLVQNKDIKLTKDFVRKCWITFTMSFLTYLISLRIVSDENYEYTLIFEMCCSAFSRPVWSLMICWIIYSCVNGAAGPLAKFLSWKYFLPLSRLSYSIYLVHLIFPIFHTMTSKTSWYFSDLMLIHSFLSNLVLSIAFAFIFSITFEVPVLALDDLVRKSKIFNENPKLNTEEIKVMPIELVDKKNI